MGHGTSRLILASAIIAAGCGDSESRTSGGGAESTAGSGAASSSGDSTSTSTTTAGNTSTASTGTGTGTGGEGGSGTGGDGGGGGGGGPIAECFPPPRRIAAGDTTTCALDDAGGGACRGGPFGDGWLPIELMGDGAPARCIDEVVAQGSTTCVHVASGDGCSDPGFHCFADPQDGWLPLGGDIDARWIAITDDDVCGFDEAGGVHCAGSSMPPELESLVPLAGVAGGPRDACAWSGAGLTCWGETASLQADAPAWPGCFADIDVGPGFACAAYDGLDVIDCWGELPRGISPRVFLPAPGADISVGDGVVCALTLGGFVRCWGDNAEGGLGVPNLDASVGVVQPQWPGELPEATAIAAGRGHVAVTTDDGAVLAWGDNRDAQICDCDETVMLPTDTSFFTP
jgi:hypothetical protein